MLSFAHNIYLSVQRMSRSKWFAAWNARSKWQKKKNNLFTKKKGGKGETNSMNPLNCIYRVKANFLWESAGWGGGLGGVSWGEGVQSLFRKLLFEQLNKCAPALLLFVKEHLYETAYRLKIIIIAVCTTTVNFLIGSKNRLSKQMIGTSLNSLFKAISLSLSHWAKHRYC